MDNAIREFLMAKPSWYMSHYRIPWSTKMASISVIFWAFLFLPSLVFYILGAFLIKQYYSTCACWIWDDYSQLGAMRLVGYLSSHIQSSHHAPLNVTATVFSMAGYKITMQRSLVMCHGISHLSPVCSTHLNYKGLCLYYVEVLHNYM